MGLYNGFRLVPCYLALLSLCGHALSATLRFMSLLAISIVVLGTVQGVVSAWCKRPPYAGVRPVALSENVFPCNPRIGDQICVSAGKTFSLRVGHFGPNELKGYRGRILKYYASDRRKGTDNVALSQTVST